MSAPRVIMGRAKRGLYAGRHIQFGNQVSEDGGNKSRRTWKPNVQTKRIFSLGLDRYIKMSLTMHALRCIDKAGGIDEYLLTTPERKLDNDLAREWRTKIAAVYHKLYTMEVATMNVKPGMEDQVPRHLQARQRGFTLEQLNALEAQNASASLEAPHAS
ncbi:hypothetical protein M758_9G138600 [Ceratodon purpureus]|uniref:Large ribosomal subunit protein bL28m n=1 Tax=Ceratodon purpureus TaxID=3225 RepID=A0A8T0GTM7_CERPU|nr:hypothetical protein KC19_9G086200 [Ceratodon purpureus]KAG0606407.1 hypothetical protein M758_9G138600 [Ceratodon purpureus]